MEDMQLSALDISSIVLKLRQCYVELKSNNDRICKLFRATDAKSSIIGPFTDVLTSIVDFAFELTGVVQLDWENTFKYKFRNTKVTSKDFIKWVENYPAFKMNHTDDTVWAEETVEKNLVALRELNFKQLDVFNNLFVSLGVGIRSVRCSGDIVENSFIEARDIILSKLPGYHNREGLDTINNVMLDRMYSNKEFIRVIPWLKY